MAPKGGRPRPSVADRLFARPDRFDFFQAVRLLERAAAERAGADARERRGPVGRDEPPETETVRLRSATSFGFAGAAVSSLEQGEPPGPDESDRGTPPELTVSFMGLVGQAGVLPDHYTELIQRRVKEKDFAFRDFLDLFNHRAISLFHRAWEKYRLTLAYERAAHEADGDDPITASLFALAGAGTGGQRGRLGIDDEAFVRFGAFFGRGPRPAACLESMLRAYFELPVDVLQFQGDEIHLGLDDRTVLGSENEREGRHACLGRSAILGSRVFDASGRFLVRVGPLTWSQFREFMPTGSLLKPLSQFVRAYVGPEFAFEVEPVLLPDKSPVLRVGDEGRDPPRLGWNTWMRAEPLGRTFDEVSFSLESGGSRVVEESSSRGQSN